MDTTTILLGYSGGIITMAVLAVYPNIFKPTVTEDPRAYIWTGVALGAGAVALDIFGGMF
jgi:hypothetical protein